MSKKAVLAALAAGMLSTAAHAAVVEFSEASLWNVTPLNGSNAFASQGLHFSGSATYYQDSRFVGAGADDSGIATSPSSPIMSVLFDSQASAVTFYGLSINTDFYAIAKDSGVSVL